MDGLRAHLTRAQIADTCSGLSRVRAGVDILSVIRSRRSLFTHLLVEVACARTCWRDLVERRRLDLASFAGIAASRPERTTRDSARRGRGLSGEGRCET